MVWGCHPAAGAAAREVVAAAVAVSSCSLCAPWLDGSGTRFLPVGLHRLFMEQGLEGAGSG